MTRLRHGYARKGSVSPTYRAWQAMHKRCNGRASSSRYYSDRGISVCPEWQSFERFLTDMGERPDGMSLDRVDVNGNYAPNNCRWATRKQQMQNKTTNVNLTLDGKTQCVAEWSRELGIGRATIAGRIKSGYSAEQALSTAMFHQRKGRRKNGVSK
jgi:hypothetical protein